MSPARIGAEQDNPYSVISDRNIFRLTTAPIPVEPPPKPPDLPKVMLTGFVGKGSSLKILLAIVPKDNKTPTVYATLTAGQKEHDVELLDARPEFEEVDIINSGTRQTLSVRSNSYDSEASAPAAAPGRHIMPRGMPPGFVFRRPPGS